MVVFLEILFFIVWLGSLLIFISIVNYGNKPENKPNSEKRVLKKYLRLGVTIIPVMMFFWELEHDSPLNDYFLNPVDWFFFVGIILYCIGAYRAFKIDKGIK